MEKDIIIHRNRRTSNISVLSGPVFTYLLLGILLVSPVVAEVSFRVNDAHCHVVNFTQNSDGLSTLLMKMNETGVEHSVIFGLSVIRKLSYYDQVNYYYYSLTDALVALEYLNLNPEQRDRFYPLICGFDPTDKNAIEHIERIVRLYPGVFVGIGEILTRHDTLSKLTEGEMARANHPALDRVYEYAAEHDMPVWLHSNIGTSELPDPIYLNEIEEVLEKHQNTRVVWCHAGYSQQLNITDHPKYIREMLGNHPNLWVDISWVIYNDVIAKDEKINEDWADLIRDFPDRFIIGTDNTGNFATYEKNIRKYDLLLNKLDNQTRDLIAYWNLYDILPKSVKRPDITDLGL